MIEQQKDKGWQFVYIGSDISTAQQAIMLGTQSTYYQPTSHGTARMFAGTSNAVTNYRMDSSPTASLSMPDRIEVI